MHSTERNYANGNPSLYRCATMAENQGRVTTFPGHYTCAPDRINLATYKSVSQFRGTNCNKQWSRGNLLLSILYKVVF